jgi:hypothetical protein
MRQLLNRFSLLLSMVFLMSCASAIPPARIADYVSFEHKTFDDVFRRINQRPLQTGLIVVSDTAEPGAAPNLPDEALVRLGENLQQGLDRVIPVAITEVISAHHISDRSRMGIGPSSKNWAGNGGSIFWPLWSSPARNRNIP